MPTFFLPDADCAVGTGERSGKRLAAPGANAVRAVKGENAVDEWSLALADRKVTMTHMRCKTEAGRSDEPNVLTKVTLQIKPFCYNFSVFTRQNAPDFWCNPWTALWTT